jgi:GTPase SAR1 family protein
VDGQLVQRRDHLNLANLGLTDTDLGTRFDPQERDLPEIGLADLPHLKYLDLTGNALTALPECVIGSADLVWLGLNFNHLTHLPETIGRLVNLQRLYLRGNALTELPIGMGSLRGLIELDLTGCAIGRLPSSMAHLGILEHLALHDRALEPDQRAAWKGEKWSALRDHLMREDVEALKQYRLGPAYQAELANFGTHADRYSEIVTAAQSMHELRLRLQEPEVRAELYPSLKPEDTPLPLDEAQVPSQFVGKVVLVGSQEHGKTCLQRALRGEPFKESSKSTDGMSRERLYLTLDGEQVSPTRRAETPGPQQDIIDLMLWDMGGQDSYQRTHRMFFTPSAVYLVVTLPREGGGVEKLDDWIELVKRRTGGEATIIVVSTRHVDRPADAALTLAGLQAKHGEIIRAVVAVDSKHDTGVPELRKLLAAVVQEPRAKCRHTWLPGWAKVLNELSNSPAPFLRWPEIQELCKTSGVVDPIEQRQVVRTGHYTGALLWREDIPSGEDVVILNPDWLSRAVARLLDDEVTQQEHGLVDIPKLTRVWRGPGRDDTPGYEPDTYPALIELMEINELAYRPKVPGKQVGEGHLLLITQMVDDKPKQDLEDKWQAISPADCEESVRVVAFRKVGDIGYEEVSDILYLLIFRLRDFSLGRTNYKQAEHWQRGLLVMDDYGSAGRIELEDRKLRITVRHRLGDGLMHSIIHRIGVRDDGYWNGRGLEKVEFVPCGPACAKGTPDAGLISMESCFKADRAGNRSVECQSCKEYVPIHQLLRQRAVEAPKAVELREWVEAILSGQRTIIQEVKQQGAATHERMSELRQFVQMQGDGILDAFTSEWKDGPRFFSLIPIIGEGWNPKKWTTMEFRVTVWCEASFRPVPFFGVKKKPGGKTVEHQGTETITLTRGWLQGARKLLSWGSWATMAVAASGTGAICGIVSAAGKVITHAEANELAAELARQQRAFKEVVGSIADDADHPLRKGTTSPEAGWAANFSPLGMKEYNVPIAEDLAMIRFLRGEFGKKDPTWGGLKPRADGKFGRIWAHPKYHPPT